MVSWQSWLVIGLLCLIIEILPPPTHFYFLCLSLGALAASITAFFFKPLWLPFVIFAVTSVALIPLLIPLARFLFTPKPHPSNVDALVGEKALVIATVGPKAAGQVKVHGEAWRAFSEQETFEKDEWVRVDRVEGTHVVVRRI
jgi:membrane protein implicated in regulation of membrane protease activity